LSTLAKRVLTAVTLLAILAATLFYLPPPAPIVLLSFFLLVGAWEWSGFFAAGRFVLRSAYTLVLLALAAVLWMGLENNQNFDALLLCAIGCWVVMAFWLILRQSVSSPLGCALFGILALLPAWYAVMRLFATNAGGLLLVWVVAIVAAADIGAYFVGRSLGRTKLAPRISPGKTREGLLGGLACACLAGGGGAIYFNANVGVFVVAGGLIALISVIGDLTVSAFKRNAGLKDSGWILPGHGGVMDRIDSLVAALPLFVAVLQLTGQLADLAAASV